MSSEIEKLREILNWYYLGNERKYSPEAWDNHQNQAISDLASLLTEARLDELEKMWAKEFDLREEDNGTYWYNGFKNDDYIRDRIVKVKALNTTTGGKI